MNWMPPYETRHLAELALLAGAILAAFYSRSLLRHARTRRMQHRLRLAFNIAFGVVILAGVATMMDMQGKWAENADRAQKQQATAALLAQRQAAVEKQQADQAAADAEIARVKAQIQQDSNAVTTQLYFPRRISQISKGPE